MELITKQRIVHAAEEAAEEIERNKGENITEIITRQILSLFETPGAAGEVSKEILDVIKVEWDFMRQVLNEVARLQDRETELLENNSKLVRERQTHRNPERIGKIAMQISALLVVEQGNAAFYEKAVRLVTDACLNVVNP
jgi:hypothetical protein